MSDGTGDAAASPLRSRQRNWPRSRVDRFAMLVEETGPGRHHHRPTDDDRDLLALVELAQKLGRVRQPTVRQRFREELHERLQLEFARQRAAGIPAARSAPDGEAVVDSRRLAEVDPLAADTVAVETLTDVNPRADIDTRADADTRTDLDTRGADPLADVKTQVVRQVRPRRSHGRLAVVIGLATGALALSGVSAASGGALPGDPLYSVKRSGEQAQLMLAGSDASRGRLHLDFARNRLAEAGRVGPDEVATVLAEMDRELAEAARLLFSAALQTGDVSLIDTVTVFVRQQRVELLRLRASVRLPGDPAGASLDLLDAVELRAEELRAAITSGCPIVDADRLGPKPAC